MIVLIKQLLLKKKYNLPWHVHVLTIADYYITDQLLLYNHINGIAKLLPADLTDTRVIAKSHCYSHIVLVKAWYSYKYKTWIREIYFNKYW